MAEEREKRVPVFDWELGDFKRDAQGRIITATEGEAMKQIALKALNTIRGVYLIYVNVDDPDLHHKYGSDVENVKRAAVSEEVKLAEFKRATAEALIYDPWVTNVTDVKVERSLQDGTGAADAAYISLTIHTIFDQPVQLEGVNLTNG